MADSIPPEHVLKTWALTTAFTLASGTRDANGVLLSGAITWPDGAQGVFTTDSQDGTTGAIDAWHATYRIGPVVDVTLTQRAVTRDASGAVVVQPDITIA